jgi:chemotaxis protein CheZ
MTQQAQGIGAYAMWVAEMSRAVAADDEAAFTSALAGLDAVRDTQVLTEVRRVTLDLQQALERFSVDSRLVELAQHQVPDARTRLGQVLRLTDDAAHRTMDLIEQCVPLVDGVVRAKLSEVLLAQEYQDLSGQIIRSVMKLIDELEVALQELVRIAGTEHVAAPMRAKPGEPSGPVIPGLDNGDAVSGQQDVDALLSTLGM